MLGHIGSEQLPKFFQSGRFASVCNIFNWEMLEEEKKKKMGLNFFSLHLSYFAAALFINLLFICTENSPQVSISLPVCHPLSLFLHLSLSSVSSVTVTYNYSADLLPVSITSGVQRNCRSVEESIVGVPGGFLDNELAQ